jgi:CBS domain-containing protein
MGLFDSIRRMVRRKRILKQSARLRAMTVGEIMTKYVITIRAEEEVIKAATKMIAEDISCLVVAGQDGTPMGVLSERDFVTRVPLTNKVFSLKIKDIMTPNPVTIPSTTKLVDAVALMRERNFRRLMVVDNGKMVGIVTQTDFTRAIRKVFTSYPLIPDLTVGHIMDPNVMEVTPKQTIVDVKQKMMKTNAGAVLIVDNLKDPTPIGIFTEYDAVMQFYDQREKLEIKRIEEYMRKYVRAVDQGTSIFEANTLMLEKNMRRLLIVQDTKIVGIMTQTDVCRYLYGAIDLIESSAAKPDATLRRFSVQPEIHGEFHGEHLKVYTVE